MSSSVWLQFGLLVVLVVAATPLLGSYMAKVYGPETAGAPPGERVFGPIERTIYRLTGVDAGREQRWTVYARSLLAFSLVSVLVVYLIQRIQGGLPLNPTDVGAVPEPLAFNTAVSFITNTNWQNYAGEITMSHLTQMAALAVQNFVSAAVGMAVAVALIRGLVRRRSGTIGNFWVDLTRSVTRILLPHLDRRRAGAGQPGRRSRTSTASPAPAPLEGAAQAHPRRPGGQPGGHQGAGDERRRLPQRQLRPPLRQPQRVHQPLPDVPDPADPVLADLHVREAGPRPQAGPGRVRAPCSPSGSPRRSSPGVRDRRQPRARRARRRPAASPPRPAGGGN